MRDSYTTGNAQCFFLWMRSLGIIGVNRILVGSASAWPITARGEQAPDRYERGAYARSRRRDGVGDLIRFKSLGLVQIQCRTTMSDDNIIHS